MAWPAAVGAAIGGIASSAASGGINTALQYWGQTSLQNRQGEYNRKAARKAYERQKEMYQNRYQWTANDMRAAGLNPILAATGGFNTAGGSQVNMANVGMGNISSPGVNISQSAKNLAQTETEEDKQTLLQRQADVEFEKIWKTRSEANLTVAEEQVALQRYWTLKEEVYLMLEQQSLTNQQKQLTMAKIKQIKAEMEKLKNIADVYKTPAGKVMTWISEIIDALNIHIGIIK